MINHKHLNTYSYKLKSNKVYQITASGLYKTTHDVKVPFRMPEFSVRTVITHIFHVENKWGDERISYAMITSRDQMVQLGLKADFGRQILEWDNTVVPMN